MFSAGYEIGEIANGRFQEEAERLVAHPFTEAIEALEAFPYPTLAALPGHTIGGGPGAGARLRPARGRGRRSSSACHLPSSAWSTRTRACVASSTRSASPRTRELFLLGSYIDAEIGTRLGARQPRRRQPTSSSRVALSVASELAANAPLSQVGNKRVIAALLHSEGTLPEDVESELIELRRASFESHDLREGMAAFAEKRAPLWRGE